VDEDLSQLSQNYASNASKVLSQLSKTFGMTIVDDYSPSNRFTGVLLTKGILTGSNQFPKKQFRKFPI